MRLTVRSVAAIAAATSFFTLSGVALGHTPHSGRTHDRDQRALTGAVYSISNEASGNRLLFYGRGADGALRQKRAVATGGNGTGQPRLSSQNSVLLSPDGRRLFAVNPGSNQISSFSLSRTGEPSLVDTVPSGGIEPDSLTLQGSVLYVVNHGGPQGPGDISGFTVNPAGDLTPLTGSTQPLSTAGFTHGGQIGFAPDGRSLIVTEEATNTIDRFPVNRVGVAGPLTAHASAADTPFGFSFTDNGTLLVSDAADGLPGQATESSYRLVGQTGLQTINGSVPSGQQEVCWTVLNKNQRYAYVTNFSSGTISSYRVAPDGTLTLNQAVAATSSPGQKSIRDENFSADGHFLYAIDINAQKIFGWQINRDGSLVSIGSFGGLPSTVAGIAVR